MERVIKEQKADILITVRRVASPHHHIEVILMRGEPMAMIPTAVIHMDLIKNIRSLLEPAGH